MIFIVLLWVPHHHLVASVFGFVVIVNNEEGVGFGAKLRVFKNLRWINAVG
jgi:hypothetical protein